ncbi:MAG: tetratricopeptide repeat protein [Rhodospirillaceae bacterium]|nr:tetratricopeptide repeat protein [Rhodospirillaceae bacterium]
MSNQGNGKTDSKAISRCIEGEKLAGMGKIKEAIQAFRQATAIDPSFANAYLSLGFLLRQQGRLDEAIECYTEATTIQPNFFQAHFNLGNALKQQGKLDEAATCFNKVLAINPAIAEAHNSLGNIFYDRQQWDEAVVNFQNALTINPNFAGASNNLGLVLFQQGRFQEAEASHRAAVRADPEFSLAHQNLSNILRISGHIGEAEKYAENAVRLAPDFADAHITLGLAQMELKQFEAATESFYKANSLKADDSEALHNLGNALKELGRLDDAVASYRKALALTPDNANIYNNLGLALKDIGQLDDALACYYQGLAIVPDQTVIWNNLKLATKALRFLKESKGKKIDIDTSVPDLISLNASQFALFNYFLQSFRPHEAGESFSNAMAALPPSTSEKINIHETGHTSPGESRLPDKLIALLHFGRSGTGLLHSLIDGHPEISSLPGIYIRGLFNAGVWDHIAAKGWRRIPERFADMFAVLFDANCPDPTPGRIGEISFSLGQSEGMTRVGEKRDESLVLDRDKFITEALRLMQSLGKVDPGSFLLIVHAAFEAAQGTTTGKDTIFYHIHNPDDYAKANFLRYAPDARLVMMVREPLQSCESWVQSRIDDNNYTSVVLRIIDMLFAIDQVIFRMQDSVGVRLEDLKERPEETLRSLCAWLGVAESPTLYQMTAQGKKWWGDPTSPHYNPDKGMTPFGTPLKKSQPGTVFSEKDRLILRTLYYPFSVRFGYREADPDGFEKDLKDIRPLLDEMWDFEKLMIEKSGVDPAKLKRNGSYLLFHAALLDRWHVAHMFKDYPHMLRPLDVSTQGG